MMKKTAFVRIKPSRHKVKDGQFLILGCVIFGPEFVTQFSKARSINNCHCQNPHWQLELHTKYILKAFKNYLIFGSERSSRSGNLCPSSCSDHKLSQGLFLYNPENWNTTVSPML